METCISDEKSCTHLGPIYQTGKFSPLKAIPNDWRSFWLHSGELQKRQPHLLGNTDALFFTCKRQRGLKSHEGSRLWLLQTGKTFLNAVSHRQKKKNVEKEKKGENSQQESHDILQHAKPGSCWQLTGITEQLPPRWAPFNYGGETLPAGSLSSLSRQATLTKLGGRATGAGLPGEGWGGSGCGAAKEGVWTPKPPPAPSKCLSPQQGARGSHAREALARQRLSPRRANEPGRQRPLADRDGVSLW